MSFIIFGTFYVCFLIEKIETMRTLILKPGLLIILAILNLNVWASKSAASDEFIEAEIKLESWMSEIIILKSDLSEKLIEEIQLEKWMSLIFLEICQYEEFRNQNLELENNSKNTIEENNNNYDLDSDSEIESWMFEIMVKN